MEQSKIIQLLKTFSAKELREFQEFVHSPFYNKNEEIRRFYDYLKRLAPKFLVRKTDPQVVYQQLYPNQKYSDKKIKYLMSDTLKLAEQYIGLQEYQQEKNQQYCHVLKGYLNRNLDKHYQAIYRKAEQNLQAQTTRNTDFYYQQYLLADIAERHFEQKKLRVFNQRLQEVADYLDLFYVSKKLEHTCEMLEWQQVLAHDYDLKLVDSIIPQIQAPEYQNKPSIAIYTRIYFLLKNIEVNDNFEQLKDLLKDYFDLFTQSEMKQAHLAIINFCMRQIRKGNSRFEQELLELYLFAIDKKLLFENAYLSPWTFKNVVRLGLNMLRLDWTETFIKTYHKELEGHFQKDAYHFSLADLNYRRRDYSKAQQHLNEVDFSDFSYSLGIREMLAKIYYETNENESLLSLIASFKIYLKRNQLISEKVQQTYENFLYFLGQLLKKEQLQTLKDEIKATNLLASRTWLLEQCT